MNFDLQVEAFLGKHYQERSGESLRRLSEGHGHAERLFLSDVWWPAVGSFEHLHPEYEVSDFKDGSRYLDFAYLRFPMKIAIEIDGYGPHARDMSRWQFADQLTRQNHLVIDGWKVLRFAYDEIESKPRRCQQTIQQMLGRWFGGQTHTAAMTAKEHQIVRFAIRKQAPFALSEASAAAGISERHARTLLQRLVQAGVLLPAAGVKRVRAYGLNPDGRHLFL